MLLWKGPIQLHKDSRKALEILHELHESKSYIVFVIIKDGYGQVPMGFSKIV